MAAASIDRVRLGKSSVMVPRIGFGTTSLADMPDTYGYRVDIETAKATVNAILDGPAPYLDTSRNYGLGRSEERIGAVIRERGGLPPDAILSTKLDRHNDTRVFDRAQARRSIEESLETLGVDKVHILHLHDPEHAESQKGIAGAIDELFRMKEEGLTDAVGLAAGNVDVMMPLIRAHDFDALITHNRFTLANRNAEPMMDLAVSKGISVLNAAPYASGVLAKGSATFKRYVYQAASEETLDPIRRIEEVCAEFGIPPGAAALQFSMRDKRVASTICGVSKPERVAQTLAWAAAPIPAEAWEALMALPFATDDPEAARVWTPG